MKRILTLMCVVLLAVSTLTACNNKKPETSAEAISAGTYDWDAARELCVDDITDVLEVILAGDANTYATTRNEWLPRIKPEAQGAMFPNTNPPQGCSSTVTYMGYSGPEYNSESAEYITFNTRVLNNQTLESADYTITIKLERGNDGYVIAGFAKEVVDDAR